MIFDFERRSARFGPWSILTLCFLVVLTYLLSACTIETNSTGASGGAAPPIVTQTTNENSRLIIRGSLLTGVTKVSIEGVSHDFAIESQTDSEIRAYVVLKTARS